MEEPYGESGSEPPGECGSPYHVVKLFRNGHRDSDETDNGIWHEAFGEEVGRVDSN